MLALTGALFAGVLTTLAPCVVPLLPVVVGGSVTGRKPEQGGSDRDLRRALVVTGALGVSVVVFTLALKASTALIGVPPQVWAWLSGGLLALLGVVVAFPGLWESVSSRLGLQGRAAGRLAAAREKDGIVGAALTGAALGPVFSSCSPLYAYVVVTVLPAEPLSGLAQLLAYVVGLCGTLLLIALAGQRLVGHLGWAVDGRGLLRRALGAVFILVGLAIVAGLDRSLQAWILENSPIRPWELDQGFIPG